MKYSKSLCFGSALMILFVFIACKSDPFLPVGSIVDPDNPITQNPGEANLCPDGVVSFQYEILPLMVSNCAFSGCHDAGTAADEIVLDSYNNIIKEVEPNNIDDSELYESIDEDDDPDDIMPPPPYQPLTLEQKDLVRNWINQGAQNTNCGTPCDPASASFATDIFPLIEQYCIGCHNSNFNQGQGQGMVNLETYELTKPYALDGSFVGSIKYDPAYSIMPPSGGQLSECHIGQVEKWISEGALDN